MTKRNAQFIHGNFKFARQRLRQFIKAGGEIAVFIEGVDQQRDQRLVAQVQTEQHDLVEHVLAQSRLFGRHCRRIGIVIRRGGCGRRARSKPVDIRSLRLGRAVGYARVRRFVLRGAWWCRFSLYA